ncbi:MAG: phosphotransferase [Dysgonamonadaceae bacterium]|nr:phosphotransferase [Dysgonamonadaceae bacterium]
MEELKQLFQQYTGKLPEAIIPFSGSGSNRKYFRLSTPEISVIGVEGTSVEENKAFIELSNHFYKQGLSVPQVFAKSEDSLFYLQEDLGDISLFDVISEGRKTGIFSEGEKELLKQTIAALPEIQFKGAEGLDFSICYPQPKFDKRTIFWDLNYFKYYFLKMSNVDFQENLLENDFEKFANILLQEQTNTFLYRDFQSRNVMIHNGKPYFIDFQGGRKGPVYYDVASFLWQAKANFPDELRNELLDVYLNVLSKYQPHIDSVNFKKQLRYFVLFRILQVLGAYGFRGYIEKKSHFIESIPFALNNLKKLLQNDFPGIPYLQELLAKLSGVSVQHSFSGVSVRRSLRLRRVKSKALLCEDTSQRLAFSNDVVENYAERQSNILAITIYSFSYKKGIPEDISGNGGGYVFDCRAIHNPGKYEEYKKLTGLDRPVIDFLEKDGEILTFLDEIYKLADKHIERYIERGFTNLMFSFGCTGGQHRSVYSAQHLGEHIMRNYKLNVTVIHREQGIYFDMTKNPKQILPLRKF